MKSEPCAIIPTETLTREMNSQPINLNANELAFILDCIEITRQGVNNSPYDPIYPEDGSYMSQNRKFHLDLSEIDELSRYLETSLNLIS